MPAPDSPSLAADLFGILAVFGLVLANGFFVAAEFSLVAIRRSRVAELVADRRPNAVVLERSLGSLDATLAATQLGITISSLALGWIGEPAIVHLIEPLTVYLPGSFAGTGVEVVAVTIAFLAITALHIVLGELAPKSLALQRTEATALAVARPLRLFLILFRPAVAGLNGLGNLVLRLFGLQPGAEGETLHSPDELKLLVQASQDAGILHDVQEDLVVRALNLGDRRIGAIMTPRPEIEWIDADDTLGEQIAAIRACRHEQILVGRGGIDEPLGMVAKQDLLDQLLDGGPLDPLAKLAQPLIVYETNSVLRVLQQFREQPVRLAAILNEYGRLEGIVTQTDLLGAFAGDLPGEEGGSDAVVARADGSLLIDAMMPVHDAFERLAIRGRPDRSVHTLAGFVLEQMGRIPEPGERFDFAGWRFEVVDLDGRRIDKLLVSRADEAG